jgi:hypothetical protein
MYGLVPERILPECVETRDSCAKANMKLCNSEDKYRKGTDEENSYSYEEEWSEGKPGPEDWV